MSASISIIIIHLFSAKCIYAIWFTLCFSCLHALNERIIISAFQPSKAFKFVLLLSAEFIIYLKISIKYKIYIRIYIFIYILLFRNLNKRIVWCIIISKILNNIDMISKLWCEKTCNKYILDRSFCR